MADLSGRIQMSQDEILAMEIETREVPIGTAKRLASVFGIRVEDIADRVWCLPIDTGHGDSPTGA